MSAVPFPDQLLGGNQAFTQADIERLRRAGYRAPFKAVDAGVAEYLNWLVS
mgnify:CR=1 FL=1